MAPPLRRCLTFPLTKSTVKRVHFFESQDEGDLPWVESRFRQESTCGVKADFIEEFLIGRAGFDEPALKRPRTEMYLFRHRFDSGPLHAHHALQSPPSPLRQTVVRHLSHLCIERRHQYTEQVCISRHEALVERGGGIRHDVVRAPGAHWATKVSDVRRRVSQGATQVDSTRRK